MTTKLCNKCKLSKPLDCFNKHPKTLSGRQTQCKECRAKHHKENYRYNPNTDYHPKKAQKRAQTLKRLYGITLNEYNEMLLAQENQCLICLDTFKRTPHVDHCHSTGNVRGLLCSNCNIGLGNFRDNVEALKRAIEYLQ